MDSSRLPSGQTLTKFVYFVASPQVSLRFQRVAHGPARLPMSRRFLAVPFKRARLRVGEYLEANEIRALPCAPDRTTPDGRRDHALFLTLLNTGARVQELLNVWA